MARKITTTNETHDELPKGVKKSDIVYPKLGQGFNYSERQALGIQDVYSLRFYKVKGLGWVLCTLHISNPSRRQSSGTAARTYAIGVNDSKLYTVGRGPHVLQEIEVHLKKDNVERLRPLLELHKKGMEDASSVRDRISSRRAQGQLHREAGRTSWTW